MRAPQNPIGGPVGAKTTEVPAKDQDNMKPSAQGLRRGAVSLQRLLTVLVLCEFAGLASSLTAVPTAAAAQAADPCYCNPTTGGADQCNAPCFGIFAFGQPTKPLCASNGPTCSPALVVQCTVAGSVSFQGSSQCQTPAIPFNLAANCGGRDPRDFACPQGGVFTATLVCGPCKE